MSDPEFHFVVSYTKSGGWRVAPEMHDLFSDGTVWDEAEQQWRLVSDEDEDAIYESLFETLSSAMEEMK